MFHEWNVNKINISFFLDYLPLIIIVQKNKILYTHIHVQKYVCIVYMGKNELYNYNLAYFEIIIIYILNKYELMSYIKSLCILSVLLIILLLSKIMPIELKKCVLQLFLLCWNSFFEFIGIWCRRNWRYRICFIKKQSFLTLI